MKIGLGIGIATLLLTMPGCIIAVDGGEHWDRSGWNQVNRQELEELVVVNREARIGMAQAEVLGLYPENLTSLKGTAVDLGAPIEVWTVSAVTRNGDYSFTRWLYFYDGVLVELRDDRVDWENDTRLENWRSFKAMS